MKINNIDFDIKDIKITQDYNQINFGFQQMNIPGRKDIKILAQTHSKNIIKLMDWMDLVMYKASYKENLNYNGIVIAGIYPINHTLNPYNNNIDVTFSVDYIDGDIGLLRQRELRKEKLKKISECQKSS